MPILAKLASYKHILKTICIKPRKRYICNVNNHLMLDERATLGNVAHFLYLCTQ